VMITKDNNGKITTKKLMSVKYGDLIIPSDAEIKDALRAIERGHNSYMIL
jgi:hypothetical protein